MQYHPSVMVWRRCYWSNVLTLIKYHSVKIPISLGCVAKYEQNIPLNQTKVRSKCRFLVVYVVNENGLGRD